jgi:hypothetical protein
VNVKRFTVAVLCFSTWTAFAQGKGDAGAPDVSKMPFSQESIRKIVTDHQPQIQECYEGILANKQDVVEGRIHTSWIITGEGLVRDAKVVKKGTTLKSPQLHDCVIAVLSSMNFPAPPGGKDQPIEYPFNLKAIR